MAVDVREKLLEMMARPERIRNMGIIAHVDHGKTTLTDSLLAGAGIISDELAGDQTWMDYDTIEQQRGVTIKAGNISMVHKFEGQEYLINLIDTPGHVDFGGEVTRALRAVDGAIVLSDAVEGIMPQTETVLRQALKENVRPLLFINKVDRYVRELKLDAEEMQQRFLKIIAGVNDIIENYAAPEFKQKWKVRVEDGSVGFGSAYQKWAIDFSLMKKMNISFAQIIKMVQEERQSELHKMIPVHGTILNMAIKHLPDPRTAQKYRIPRIWYGDQKSAVGQALLNCDPNGPLVACITKVLTDPHAGIIASARVFSGTATKSKPVFLHHANTTVQIQQLGIYKGPFRLLVDSIPAGNIIAILGMKDASSGETIASEKIEPFESIKHWFDPVVTKAIEPKTPKDLPKLIEALKEIAREDPGIKITINEETGEYLMAGLGELHLEVWMQRMLMDWKLEVNTSSPIVVYRETATKKGPEVEGKSPNKHNKFYITVEPMPEAVSKAIESGDISVTKIKGRDLELQSKLIELGMDKEEAKKVKDIYEGCMFLDMTRGQVYLPEIMESVLEGFHEVIDQGPMAKEKCKRLLVKVMDAKLHEDTIHRGPAQVIPAVRNAIKLSMLNAEPRLLEPIQKIRIDAPQNLIGACTSLVQSRRGRLEEIKEERGGVVVIADMPVASMFGFTNDLRSATAGRGIWSLIDSRFETQPNSLQMETVAAIRKRKGLPVQEVVEQD